MMHYESIVATICDQNKKPLREYDVSRMDNGRSSTVNLPFNTEYQILIKNNQDRRIRLDIDIDGTNVTESGLVFREYQNAHIERFINSDKKFKFVPLSNGNVADPTNGENGVITIVSHMEIKPLQPVFIKKTLSPAVHVVERDYSLYSKSCEPVLGSRSVNYSTNIGGSTGSATIDWMCEERTTTVHTSCQVGQSGATVEGSKSNQGFIDVHWNGDCPFTKPITFKFKLLGMNSQDNKEWEEFLRLKQKFNQA
jgi:hypothetical protein